MCETHASMSKILEFSELLMTKFCHDIAGAIGAVNNGIEFLEEPDHQNIKLKAMELISINGKEAAAKLKFYRFIYGVTAGSGETDISETKELAKEFFEGSNIKLSWQKNNSTEEFTQLTHRASKLLLNMVYAASGVLISGGNIDISVSKLDNGKSLVINATGPKIKNMDDLTHILNNHELRDIKLNNVQIHLTAKIATTLNVIIKCEYTDSSLTLTADLV
jgi:histidine phosphotransferase ChpT